MRASGRDFCLLTASRDSTVGAQLPCSFQAKRVREEGNSRSVMGQQALHSEVGNTVS